jgi:hypothetical protein
LNQTQLDQSSSKTDTNIRGIHIYFDGIFQDRLATDDDPADHPRGENGWTFACTGEPNFDRIIRFNSPVSPRRFIDKAGVTVNGSNKWSNK